MMPIKITDMFEQHYKSMIDNWLAMGLKKIGISLIRLNTDLIDRISAYLEDLGRTVSVRHSKSRITFFELSKGESKASEQEVLDVSEDETAVV